MKKRREKKERENKRIDADIPTNSTWLYYSNGQLHACCVTTPTPVTSETRRGFPYGRARMRVQNTLHRVAKKGWVVAGEGVAEGGLHEGGWRKGVGGKGSRERQTGFESACQNHFS